MRQKLGPRGKGFLLNLFIYLPEIRFLRLRMPRCKLFFSPPVQFYHKTVTSKDTHPSLSSCPCTHRLHPQFTFVPCPVIMSQKIQYSNICQKVSQHSHKLFNELTLININTHTHAFTVLFG